MEGYRICVQGCGCHSVAEVLTDLEKVQVLPDTTQTVSSQYRWSWVYGARYARYGGRRNGRRNGHGDETFRHPPTKSEYMLIFRGKTLTLFCVHFNPKVGLGDHWDVISSWHTWPVKGCTAWHFMLRLRGLRGRFTGRDTGRMILWGP